MEFGFYRTLHDWEKLHQRRSRLVFGDSMAVVLVRVAALNVGLIQQSSRFVVFSKVNSRSRSLFAVARPSVVCLSVCRL